MPVLPDLLPPPPAVAADWRTALLADRPAALTQLYRRAFPGVRQHVLRHGGTAPDAQDVFQDALVVFFEKTMAGTLILSAEPAAYLAGVSRHLWQREQERRARHPHAPLAEAAYDLPDDPGLTSLPAAFSVLTYVEQLGEKCRRMLLAFYYFGQPLATIAADFNYRSTRSATVQKFKCLERLRDAVRAALPNAFNQ